MNTKLEIDFITEKSLKQFQEWFRKEGFDLFTKSKFNVLTKTTDDYITCLATDEIGYIELQ